MKGVVLGGKADGPTWGPPTVEPPKKIKQKKLRKISDLSSKVLLTMFNLTRKGKDDKKKSVVANEVPENQVKFAYQPTKEVLDVALIHMVVLVDIQGNFSKITNTKRNVENIIENVSSK